MTKPLGIAASVAALALAATLSTGVLAQANDNPTPVEAKVAPPSSGAPAYPWPNQFSEAGQAFTIYPPQLERWQGDRLEGQSAVAVQPAGADKPFFGVVWLSARTEVDSATGTVRVREISASRASFPTAAAQSGGYLDAIRRHLSTVTWTVSRDRLESELAIEHASRDAQNQPLRNTPPRILYSEVPAILVPVDGAPQLREMAGLDLLRVINTRALILQDKTTHRFYLYVADHWMEATSIEGPWSEASVRPSSLDEAKEQVVSSGQVELVEGGEDAADRVPVVYVTTAPAELVQTDGPPQYLPIQGTNLLYVTNTPNRLFLDLTSQKYYLLLSGRWYRTAALSQGSWEYVPGTNLPRDFAMIPSEHPTETVREAVPGTPQAQEAVIQNSVPQVAAVKRSAASLEITYDGPPQFQPIEGTPLQYAVNAPLPVIQVDADSYYALDNGVWFVAASPYGAWTTATWVPPVIYTIPRSSRLHYVTYVRIYDATPEVVYEGYTPGYAGSYVGTGTVVYGTGWYYTPWIGSVWYCPPVTWGFGFTFFNTWWGPWPYYRPWYWAGWAPYPWYRPWWGPWIAPAPVVVVGPRFGPHPVVVGHGAVPVHRVNVTNIHANNVNVTNVFGRWGGRVATPIGAPRVAANGNGPPQWNRGRGGAPQTLGQSAAAAMNSSFAGAAGGRPGPDGMPGNRPMPNASAPNQNTGSPPNQNVQSFRRTDGQWQQFQGNGRWQNLNPANPNSMPRMNQSPPPQAAQNFGPRPGSVGGVPVTGGAPTRGPVGGAPVTSGVPMRGPAEAVTQQAMAPRGPSTPAPVQARPLPGPRPPVGAQPNAWSGSTVPRAAPNSVPGQFGGRQFHSFTPHGARFAQGGGDVGVPSSPPVGRAGGSWVQNQGGGAPGGNGNVGGRPMTGGQSRAGGGGARAGGIHMR